MGKACIEYRDKKNVYIVLMRKLEGKGPLGKCWL
jgi:hypothetical protein